MESVVIIQEGYTICFFQNNLCLNIYIKDGKEKEKDNYKFKPLKMKYKDGYKKYFSNFEILIEQIKNKIIKINMKEILGSNKKYIKYINLTLFKDESNELKEIISKKIYLFNVEYYLTEGSNNLRINSIPFYACIKKDYFNIEDILDLIDEEDLLNIYNIDEYKYFNHKLGAFVDIKEGAYARHKQTQTANYAAYQTEAQEHVGVSGAHGLGMMGAGGGGNMGGGGGMNPAAMMAGMAVGGAIGQNIAGNMNNMMSGMNQQRSQQQQTTQQTPPPIGGVMYNVAVNGQPTGPFDMATLSKMIIAGEILKESLIWTSGMSAWQKAGEVDNIKGMFSEMPPIPSENIEDEMPPISNTEG